MSEVEGMLHLARHVLLLALVIVCAYTDIARGKVYSFLTAPAIVIGFLLSMSLDILGGEGSQLVASLQALAIGVGIFGVVYLMRGIGGGDVVLMGAIGALAANWRMTLLAAFYAAVVGAVIGVGFLVWKKRLGEGLKQSFRLLVTFGRKPGREELKLEETFPYATAIAIGAVWAWFEFYAGVFHLGAAMI